MGIFDGGLLGLGGLNMGGNSPSAGLLGGFYDPEEMKRQQMKQFLLGAGVGLLNQGPSDKPITFGQTLGAGLSGGLLGAQKAQEDYQQNAMLGYRLAQEQKQQAWQEEQQGRQKAEWDRADQQRLAQTSLVNSIDDPAKRAFAQAYPEAFAKSYQSQLFPDPATQDTPKAFADLFQGTDGKWYQRFQDGRAAPIAGLPDGVQFVSPYQTNFDKARGTEAGKAAVETQAAAPGQLDDIAVARDLLAQVRNSPSLDWGVGGTSVFNRVPGTSGYGFQRLVDQSKSGAFLTAIQKMKGLGALSNQEGESAKAAINRMDTAMSKEDFLKAVDDYETVLNIAEQRIRQRAGAVAPAAPAQGGTSGKTSSGVPWSIE